MDKASVNSILCNFLLCILALLFTPFFVVAQNEYVVENYLRNTDYVYQNNIKSVRLFPVNEPLAYPVIALNSNQTLQLLFDDLAGGFKNYTYTLLHFNHNWQASDLQPYEYIDGFSEAEIFNYEYAYNTNINYTHYQLTFPNNEMSITKSGNYLLLVYENGDKSKPIITKHFFVVEQIAIVKSAANAFMFNNFFVDFTVDAKRINTPNPYQEFRVNIMQNHILSQSIQGLTCNLVSNGELVFNQVRKGNLNPSESYRYFDLSSIKYASKRIENVEKQNQQIEVTLKTDEPNNNNYNNFNLGGNYYVDIISTFNDELQANYATVNFSFFADAPFENANVYVTGGFCSFTYNKQNSLYYNYEKQQYQGSYLLKQGLYNYTYILIDDNTEKIVPLNNNQSYYEAINNFQILVYYLPFGQRYERLIGYENFNSNF